MCGWVVYLYAFSLLAEEGLVEWAVDFPQVLVCWNGGEEVLGSYHVRIFFLYRVGGWVGGLIGR